MRTPKPLHDRVAQATITLTVGELNDLVRMAQYPDAWPEQFPALLARVRARAVMQPEED